MAPGIVEAINQKSNAQEIWNEVYKDLVEPCVNMIHNNKNGRVLIRFISFIL